MASASSSGQGAGVGSECEGEDQDESSSSSSQSQAVSEARAALGNLNIQDDTQKEEDELTLFRQQWQRELDSTPSPQKEMPPKRQIVSEDTEPMTEEDKAKALFLRGVELERGGQLYEAIQHYKRAMQILPDVETRLYESADGRPDSPELASVSPEPCEAEAPSSSDDEAEEGEELVSRLQRVVARRGVLCQQQYQAKGAHISWLPYEVLLVVLRWVVSAELDAVSLERVAGTCRGLYVAAREPDVWRSLCVKTWGLECGTPRANGFPSWRQMYVERPRLQLHGCYISKTTYLRHGENSFQDQSYRPWYLVEYYRYLRFFPEGLVLMLTTAEEPAACVAHLRHRAAKAGPGVMAGHYRLIGDKVVIVIKKAASERKPLQPTNTRFRSRRKDSYETQEQSFHLELELRKVRSRRNFQLLWVRYAVCARREQWTQFELSPSKFPPFAFSRVRAYSADATSPLPSTHVYT